MYILRFDGLFREAPGHPNRPFKAGFMCYGWLISKDEALVARGHGAFARSKDATSIVAEYLALIEGLEALRDLGIYGETVKVCGDAKSIIDQMQGEAAVNSPSVIPLFRRAKKISESFQDIFWDWIPRRKNREADSLTRRAMRQMRFDAKNYKAAMQAIVSNDRGQANTRKFLPLIDLRIYQQIIPDSIVSGNGWS